MPQSGDGFDALTTRQLRKECTSRGIDLIGCFDKDAILQRLRKASSQAHDQRRRDAANQAARNATPAPPDVDIAAEAVPSEVPLRTESADQDATMPEPAINAAPAPPDVDIAAEAVPSEVPRETESADQDATMPEPAINASVLLDGRARPEAPSPLSQTSDKAEASSAYSRPDTNIDIEASYEKAISREDVIQVWDAKKESKTSLPTNISSLAMNSLKLADRSALEVIPMRALIKECKLLGLDVSGLYAKCEVIKKLVAELDRSVLFAGKEIPPKDEESLEGSWASSVLEGNSEHPTESKQVDSEFMNVLPQPTGPPIALSPFPDAPRPTTPTTPPRLDPFDYFFGNRVVEEEISEKGEQDRHDDQESDVEEIVVEVSPRAAKASKELADSAFLEAACEAVPGPCVPEMAPRPHASISELFRLPLEDLLVRWCEAQGITVKPGEPKGLLISKLRQAMSRCAEAPPPAPEIDSTPAKPSDSQPPGPAPTGPEVFHMASDDSQDEAGEVSDNDFFPDFPGVAASRAVTPIDSEVEKDEERVHEDVGTDSKDHVKEADECENVERASFPIKLPVEANHADHTESSPVKCAPPANPAEDRDDMAATDKDADHDGSSSERDCGMFDFDDLDEAEVHVTPSKHTDVASSSHMDCPAEPAEPIPAAHTDGPATEPIPAVPAAASTPPNIDLETGPPEQKPQPQPEESEKMAPETEVPSKKIDDESVKNPLLRFTTKELLELARSRGVDVRGCVEKSDIVDRLTRAPRVQAQAQAHNRPGVSPKPAPPQVPHRFEAPKVAQSYAPQPRRPAKAHASKAPRRPAEIPTADTQTATQAPSMRHPGEIPDGWSSRVQTWFGRYPGFSAMLPPEAEMWTDQELDVYFGSNGDIWPRGKRPAWFGKPSTEPETKSSSKVQGPRTYPDLKVHFQTLDLAETTPPEIIRRHYRRLARDIHPDKHPENVEEATRRFQQVTEAYEAIANRLKL